MEIQSECSQKSVSSVIADSEEAPVAVTGILRPNDNSDNAKLESAEILVRHSFLFDGALGDEPRRESNGLVQELEQLQEDACV